VSAEDAAREVMERAPFTPVRLYSSDQPRCADLAERLSAAWSVPLDKTSALREMSFGEWDGRSYDEIDAADGERWRAWCADWRHQTPPGGESVDAFVERIESWLRTQTPDSETLLVTHAGVIRVMQVLSGAEWSVAMATEHPYLGWTQHRVQSMR
jgi:alpha-ribazole phosphatase